jgi:hypothetical protein
MFSLHSLQSDEQNLVMTSRPRMNPGLIRPGVPGRILRKIVFIYLSDGRSEFTSKEIRLAHSFTKVDSTHKKNGNLIGPASLSELSAILQSPNRRQTVIYQ